MKSSFAFFCATINKTIIGVKLLAHLTTTKITLPFELLILLLSALLMYCLKIFSANFSLRSAYVAAYLKDCGTE